MIPGTDVKDLWDLAGQLMKELKRGQHWRA